MSEFEKASIRVFMIIMIGLGFIMWLQLQPCATPPTPRIEIENIDDVSIDSSLA